MIEFYNCHANKQECVIKIQNNRPMLEKQVSEMDFG